MGVVIGGKSQQFAIAEIDTVFNLHRPSGELARFVDVMWLYKGVAANPQTERILPTGTFELAINLNRDRLSFRDIERNIETTHKGAVVSGAHGRSFSPSDEHDVFIIGVHFKPGGAFPFLGLPAGELTDSHVDLESLWGRSATTLRERLCEAHTTSHRFSLLESALLDRLRSDTDQHYAVAAALELFEAERTAPRVRETAKYIGLSERRFIEVFKAEVGLTPKLFSRILRFQQTRMCIASRADLLWADLALDLGYFDQSHLIREFQEFAGLTPTKYLDRQNPRA
jgi:AraC-like DNA-binding protein